MRAADVMGKRIVAVVMLLPLWVQAVVAPASASTDAIVSAMGSASVGKWFDTTVDADGCTSNGDAVVAGRGLYFPLLPDVPGFMNGDLGREDHGVWQISTLGAALVARDQAGNLGYNTAAVLQLCGWLGPVADGLIFPLGPRFDGLGSSCWFSRGHDGRGLVLLGSGQLLQVQDLGWPASAGGLLHIQGRYMEVDEASGTTKDKLTLDGKGSVTGWVQAQGGAGCLGFKDPATNNGNGAQFFNVVMSLGFHNETMPVEQNEDSCKGNGGESQMDPPHGKKGGDKPAMGPCPPKGT